MEKDCLFCKIARKELPANILYEDEKTMAILDISPVANGHSLVFPKEHFVDLMDTPEAYLAAVAKTKKLVALKINQSALAPKGFNYLSNQGTIANQVIGHYHEHILPKYDAATGFKADKNVADLLDQKMVYEMLTK